MIRTLSVLIATLLLLIASPALAQDWSQTFHPDSLPEELREIRVVIAPGGPGATGAGAALRKSLLEAGSPMAIINPVMSSVEGLADDEVIARLRHLPVDAVVIVRTFNDDPPSVGEDDAIRIGTQDEGSLAALFEDSEANTPDAEPSADAENTEDTEDTEEKPVLGAINTDDPALIAALEEGEAPQHRDDDEEASSNDAQTSQPEPDAESQTAGGLALRGTLSVSINDGPTASMAMITFYSIEGAALAGFMVYPGVPLTAEQRRNIGRGISQEAVDATQSAIKDVIGNEGTGAQAQSGRLRLQKQGDSWRLHDTETGETTARADIYRTLGRDDLASAYETNARSKARRTSMGRITGYTGLALLAGGSALAISTYFREFPAGDPAVAMCSAYVQPAMQNNCRAQESFDALSGQRITGLSLAGVGIAAAIIGLVIRSAAALYNPHPLSFPELNTVVHQTNIAASQSVGGVGIGVEGGTLPETEDAEGMRLELSPYLQGGPDTRGGLHLRGRW